MEGENRHKPDLVSRRQEVKRREHADSIDILPRYEIPLEILPNGYIAAYACGKLSRQRYINERMEVELANFKKELDRRFSRS